MTSCLTCEEVEQQICDLLTEISSISGCQGMSIKEDDTQFDYTPILKAKQQTLMVLERLQKRVCAGSLYEFVHVPCVKPARCEGSSCTVPSPMRTNRRRYRR